MGESRGRSRAISFRSMRLEAEAAFLICSVCSALFPDAQDSE